MLLQTGAASQFVQQWPTPRLPSTPQLWVGCTKPYPIIAFVNLASVFSIGLAVLY